MPKETQQIDMLFLELSQFTSAKTERELSLAKTLKDLMAQCPIELQDSPAFLDAWDNAIIKLDCMGMLPV